MDGQDQHGTATPGHNELTPDQAVSMRPQKAEQPTPPRQTPPEQVQPPVALALSQPEPSQPGPTPATPEQTYQPGPYAVVDGGAPEAEPAPEPDIQWSADEFVAHAKTPQWYLALGVGAVLAAIAAYFIADIVTSIVIIVCALLFGYVAGREPRQLQYGLSNHGIHIGSKSFPYSDFNGFAIMEEGPMSSINLMPMKRFSPIMSMNYHPADEQRLLEVLTRHLPYANHKRTMTDDMMRRIRF